MKISRSISKKYYAANNAIDAEKRELYLITKGSRKKMNFFLELELSGHIILSSFLSGQALTPLPLSGRATKKTYFFAASLIELLFAGH